MIGTFDEASSPIWKILNRHWDLLRLDPDLLDTVGTRPQITYRKGKSIKDRLVHSHLDPPVQPSSWLSSQIRGCYRCGKCISCRFILTGPYFVSNQMGQKFNIPYYINCKTTFVIYKATCKCGKEYIGKTIWEFRRRVGEHLGDIRHERDTPLARHLLTCQNGSTTDLKFIAIDHVWSTVRRGNTQKVLLQRETYWIHTLRTMTPKGLNDQLFFNCFLWSSSIGSVSTFGIGSLLPNTMHLIFTHLYLHERGGVNN